MERDNQASRKQTGDGTKSENRSGPVPLIDRPVTAAIYARACRLDPDCSVQLTELGRYASLSGWDAVQYIDQPSGKASAKGPVLTQLLADARLKKFDAVVVWKLDRLGRSLAELAANVLVLDQLGIRFIVPRQVIDTDRRSPIARLLLVLLAALADFEGILAAERSSAGLKEYRRRLAKRRSGQGNQRHSKSGKDLPVGRPARSFSRDQVRVMRQQGMSWRAIGGALGVPESTVRGALKRAA